RTCRVRPQHQREPVEVGRHPVVPMADICEALWTRGSIDHQGPSAAEPRHDFLPQPFTNSPAEVADEHAGRHLFEPSRHLASQADGSRRQDKDYHDPSSAPGSGSKFSPPATLPRTGSHRKITSAHSFSIASGALNMVARSLTHRSTTDSLCIRSRIARRVSDATSNDPDAATSKATGIAVSALYKSAMSYTRERSWPVWITPSPGAHPRLTITAW